MGDRPVSRSPLMHVAPEGQRSIDGDNVRIVERPDIGKVLLRGESKEPAFLAAVRAALELDLPLAPNTSSETPPVSALWLAPDEWMLVCAPGSETAVATSLKEALVHQHASVVDVSDARTVLQIIGTAARDTLAKGCALDLHPRAFAFGDVAQTMLAKAAVILHQTSDENDEEGPVFDIYVPRSFSDYLWRWLTDSTN